MRPDPLWRTDLRLVPAAVGAWGAAAALMTWPVLVGAGSVLAAVGCAVIGAVVLVRGGAMPTGAVAAGLAGAGAAGVCASLALISVGAGHDIRQPAYGGEVEVVGTVRTDPVHRAGWSVGPEGSSGRWVSTLQVSRVQSAAGVLEVDLPVRLELPGEVVPPPVGAVLLVRGSSREPPGPQVAMSVSAPGVHILSPPGPIDAAANSVRSSMWQALAPLGPQEAALVAGLAVGDESGTPAPLAADMRDAGLSHLTAVSGGNVAIVLGAVLLVGRALAVPMLVRVGAAGLALLGYVILVRPEPSVLRAAAMGTIWLLALTVGARRAGVPALSAAVLVLVCVSPQLAVSVGFALSVAATAGLLTAAPGLLRRLDTAAWSRRLPFSVRAALALTVAAQVATAPLIASMGAGISLAAIPANLLAAPVVPWVTVWGLLAAVLAPWLPAVAIAAAHIAAPGGWWIATIAERAAALPHAVVPWPAGALGAVSVLGVIGAVAALRALVRRSGVRPPRILVATLVLAGLAIVAVRPPGAWPPAGWIVVACDIGQGDALVLRGTSGAVLVDTGPDPVTVDRCLRDLGVDALAAVVLTHAHADHTEGLAGVVRGRSVGEIIVSPLLEPLEQAERTEQVARNAGIPLRVAVAGDVRRVDERLGWRVLWPERVIREVSAPNNTSVVLLAEVFGQQVLLAGDLEIAGQVAVRAGTSVLAVDVAKVPHHGSAHFDPVFPGWAAPRIALVSAGRDNRYGHPTGQALDAWAHTGALIGRTDRDGDLAVVLEGADLTLVRRGITR